jgi:hypothetical protein
VRGVETACSAAFVVVVDEPCLPDRFFGEFGEIIAADEYDLEVDTTHAGSIECARIIVGQLALAGVEAPVPESDASDRWAPPSL